MAMFEDLQMTQKQQSSGAREPNGRTEETKPATI
jgi:hypothetical protein